MSDLDYPKEALLDPWFHACLLQSIETQELVQQFDRLHGHNLTRRGSPLDIKIDEATGRIEAGVRDFAGFVYHFVYSLVPRPE